MMSAALGCISCRCSPGPPCGHTVHLQEVVFAFRLNDCDYCDLTTLLTSNTDYRLLAQLQVSVCGPMVPGKHQLPVLLSV